MQERVSHLGACQYARKFSDFGSDMGEFDWSIFNLRSKIMNIANFTYNDRHKISITKSKVEFHTFPSNEGR
jgi:hypothetical protein